MSIDLTTDYLGLKIQNPLVISSCSLTKDLDGVKKCAAAGPGAIVIKSLFEEQVESDSAELEQYQWFSGHSEARDYLQGYRMALGPRDYLDLITAAKRETNIPIIASLNCVSPRWWSSYASQLQSAGADALELNMALLPSSIYRTGQEVEDIYFSIIKGVKDAVSIPVSAKIGPYFSSLPQFIDSLIKSGIAGVVLFNRFYQLDIDIDKQVLKPGYKYSSPEETLLPLRWVSILYGQLKCDLAVSTGVHHSEEVIKQILAGATVTQLCSTLFINELSQISQILSGLKDWMASHGYADLSAFRGKMSRMAAVDPENHERIQYIKALVGLE